MTISNTALANTTWLIQVSGRLDQSQTKELEIQLNQLLQQNPTQLIVDLTHVTYINSGGLRTLVSAWRKARQQKGNLTLCGLNHRLQEIFNMVGFDKVFQIYPTHTDAQNAIKE